MICLSIYGKYINISTFSETGTCFDYICLYLVKMINNFLDSLLDAM